MCNKKFDFSKVKEKNELVYPGHLKFHFYRHFDKINEIRNVLLNDAEDYCRKIHKIAPMFKCETYRTKDGKIAVLELNTPKKRFLYKRANRWGTPVEELFDLRNKYGFIPRPVNVLKKYIDYGYMKSQDVEHLYHNMPVDWEISEDLETFREAYRINLDDKDVIMPGFNGYSCMSEEPDVGSFYWYFGAYILVFYKQGTKEIVGRMVLWKDGDQLYYYKGYVLSLYQVKAAEVVEELKKQGKITTRIPNTFKTYINARCPDKLRVDVYDEVADKIRVPYIDEDLELNSDKTELSFMGRYGCQRTNCQTLRDYGIYVCEECGCELDEEDAIDINDYYYCRDCVHYCNGCDEYFEPDADGAYVNDEWYCNDCLKELFEYCDMCHEWKGPEEMQTCYDKDGREYYMCDECRDEKCEYCDRCSEWFLSEDTRNYNGETLCIECYEEAIKEAKDE